MIRIKFDGHMSHNHLRCCICGENFETGDGVIALAYQGEERIGNVCEDCVKAGPSTIKERLIENAKELREWAEREAIKLEEKSSHEFIMPTWEEYKKTEKETTEEFKRSLTDEERENLFGAQCACNPELKME